MTTDQKIFLQSLFKEVDEILSLELDKLLEAGIEPDLHGNHTDKRWKALKEIQEDKENFEDSYYVLGKDAWSFESKVKVGESKRDNLFQRLSDYQIQFNK